MKYTPQNSVWEITYACNMRCKHCGSGCGEKYPDELTRDEALSLCDDLVQLGLKVVTLSGGEPLLHPHWDEIANRLTSSGITVNMISNGWFIDEDQVKKAQGAGIVNIGVSLDGLKETHDFIRKPGSFEHVMAALNVMRQAGMPTVVCTSVNKKNLEELPRMKEVLVDHGVQRWQFQVASPMGNLLDHPDLICTPVEVNQLIDFSYNVMQEKMITIDLADDIGYFNIKENEIRKQSFGFINPITVWSGCQAGKCVMGIRANGDISGCLSIRDDSYLEGNVRERSLEEIWNGKGAFAWNREFNREKLSGFCRRCQYANYCLGGCTGLKLTFSGSLQDNTYCSFRQAVEQEAERIKTITDPVELFKLGKEAIDNEEYQMAELYLYRARSLSDPGKKLLSLLGYVYYQLENFTDCIECNVEVLRIDTQDAYAHKGLGLALAASGSTDEGIKHLQKAIDFAEPEFTDPYFDIAVVLDMNKRSEEALRFLNQGRKISAEFTESSNDFYHSLLAKIKAVG